MKVRTLRKRADNMGNKCCCCEERCEMDNSYYFIKGNEYCSEHCLEKKLGEKLDV